MGVKSILGRGLNPKQWLGIESLKQQTKVLSQTFKSAILLKDQEHSDHYKPASFEECLQHYQISEDDLKIKMRNSLWTAYFCLGLSVGTLSYMLYQFGHHMLLGALMCITLTLLLWVMALREHFYFFQMRQRRLGCTLKEWFSSLFKKNG